MGTLDGMEDRAPGQHEEVRVWAACHLITMDLLAMVQDDQFDLKPGSGKTIRSNFVHIVGVRKMALEDKLKAAKAKVPPLDWKTASREELIAGLSASHNLVCEALTGRLETTGRAKWSPVLLLGYLIAHEAHHRSQVETALRVNGQPLTDDQSYSLWDWSRRMRSAD